MLFFFFSRSGDHRDLHSFPTRRSSDLVEALAAALKFAHFELVSANYDVKGTVLEGRIKPYVVKTLGGIKVGLFGLGVSPVALITPANFKGITYNDPVVAAREVVKALREKERCADRKSTRLNCSH